MKNALALIFAASIAGPLAAQEVPLNTVTGGTGVDQVDGQAEMVLGSLATNATILVATVAAISVVASQADDEASTTSP